MCDTLHHKNNASLTHASTAIFHPGNPCCSGPRLAEALRPSQAPASLGHHPSLRPMHMWHMGACPISQLDKAILVASHAPQVAADPHGALCAARTPTWLVLLSGRARLQRGSVKLQHQNLSGEPLHVGPTTKLAKGPRQRCKGAPETLASEALLSVLPCMAVVACMRGSRPKLETHVMLACMAPYGLHSAGCLHQAVLTRLISSRASLTTLSLLLARGHCCRMRGSEPELVGLQPE